MLRTIRIILAIIVLSAITILFTDITGMTSPLGFLTKWQLIPAVLALNAIALACLTAGTLIFGRVYCSVLCPLGIMQDGIIFFRRRFAGSKRRRPGMFKYRPESKALRYTFLATFAILLAIALIGLIPASFAGLLDPYSIFGRISGQLGMLIGRPLWGYGAAVAADHGSVVLDAVPSAAAVSAAVLVIAAIQLMTVGSMAWSSGRSYCNTVCPVGTLLGLLSRFSLLRPYIDTDKCNNCGTCGRHCKSQCIDTKAHTIDYSRCVVCMDCIDSCRQGAVSYTLRRRTPAKNTPANARTDGGRRAFIATALAAGAAGVASAADKVTDGGLAPVRQKQQRDGINRSVPCGAISLRHLRSHCTACQLCITACPNGVLKPSTGLDGFMQPRMRFTNGWCRPECTACSEVCPTGALTPVDGITKASTKTGTAVVDAAACISAAYGQTCGNCARHCPAGAIAMVRGDNGNMRPSVDAQRCIGCGSCEYHCPSGVVSQLSAKTAAIYVEGLDQHRTI